MGSKNIAIAASFGRRIGNQILAPKSKESLSASSLRRVAHYSSSYDKNVEEEEEVRPDMVPDHVIDLSKSDKYWGPHPTTGVFTPASSTSDVNTRRRSGSAPTDGSPSVLDQTAWFRPLEDVEKPPLA